MENKQNAYITRAYPSQCIHNLPDALAQDKINIGWANIRPKNFYHFDKVNREALKKNG